jgi:hypothetical protein
MLTPAAMGPGAGDSESQMVNIYIAITARCGDGKRSLGGNAQPCYTGLALSDLVVSGALPLKATLPCTDFPKPLQRNP